jgi:hypothetical protein
VVSVTCSTEMSGESMSTQFHLRLTLNTGGPSEGDVNVTVLRSDLKINFNESKLIVFPT